MQESTGKETDELSVGSDKAPGEEIPVCQRVAIIMVALGEEASGQVMKFLSDFEIEEITQALADIKNVTPQIMDLVLEDFEQHLMAGHYIS
jgi:flagellar motor switch protein FliG